MKFVPSVITRNVARQALTAQKHSPTLLFAVGVIGVGATVVLACRATLKSEEILTEHAETMDGINSLQHREYSEDDRQKDKVLAYTKLGMELTKLYGPAIVVGVVSIGALAGSHRILTKRNAALTAAYAALEKGFKQYRARVVNELGEDKDREFRYGAVDREFVEETDKGPKVQQVRTVGEDQPSIYARFFDQLNPNWKNTPEYNRFFLQCQQEYANNMLKARGHVFLNDVYDSLGIDRTSAGAVVGWVISKDGDNFIDFGIFNGNKQVVRDFVNGREGSILLDFNVDGVIYDKI